MDGLGRTLEQVTPDSSLHTKKGISMANLLPRDENGNPDIQTFENTGFFYGSLLGMLVGVVIAGPHFFDWTLPSIFLTIAVATMVIGFLGWFSVAVAAPPSAAVVEVSDPSESEGADFAD
jgi:hypothetical protein